MEPVPETERMEEFRSSPMPSLRLQSAFSFSSPESESLRKPPNLRRSTDPIPSSPSASAWMSSAGGMAYRPRTRSPLSGFHSRSHSVASFPPPMGRTQSMPGLNAAGHVLYTPQTRSQSPMSPSRIRIPRKPVDEAFPTSPTRVSVHDPETRKLPDVSNLVNPAISSTPLVRTRRPSSPLHQVAHWSTGSLPAGMPAAPNSVTSSPSFRPLEPVSYTLAASMPSSSVPSTPTSARSRSPSISSLETIPDSPDAEEAALEAERIAQLKAAADAVDGGDGRTKSGTDLPTRGRTLSFGSRDKRKRWSVCGAERRQDLDLETIWED